jgi:hypothetical protein
MKPHPAKKIKNIFCLKCPKLQEQALRLFMNFPHRNLMICTAERTANDMGETGVVSPPLRGRWIKPDETMK